ncbi:MAG: RagB/SusD family nutrient uptake outer membrane protein [Rikenellaceae bacterium]
MKRNILNILVVLGIILSFSSCNDFLDKEPTNVVVSETAMRTLYDAGVMVNGLYVDMKWYDYYGTYMQLMGDERGDNIQPRTMSSGWTQIYTLGYDSESNTYFSMWTKCYETIMRCNTLIENIDNLELASSSDKLLRDDYKGQAYAVRALNYFDLARLYGYPYAKDNGASLGAVIITNVVSPSEAKQPRNTVAQTYEQILTDLGIALPLLSKSTNTGHFNYWAAKLLQARVYLYKGDWNNAYNAAKEVIDDSPYSLVSNADYINYWKEEGASETLLELFVNTQSTIDDDGGYVSMFHNLWHGDVSAGASLIPTVSWVNLIESEPGDVRAQFVRYDSKYEVSKAWLAKFPGNNGTNFRLNNPRLLRLAEAYLIAAEGALKGSAGVTAASNYLNVIRKRANPSVANVTATDDLIQIERRKEFIGEGHRFFDQMRLGKSITRKDSDGYNFAVSAGCPETITWSYDRIVLPISHTERQIYPALQQNPGYTE